MTPNALMELADRADKLSARLSQHDSEQSLIWAVEAKDIATQLRTAAAEGGAVGFTSDAALRTLAAENASGVMFGTYSERYERTVPLYLHPPTDSGAGRDGERLDYLHGLLRGVDLYNILYPHYDLARPNIREAIDTAIAGAAGEGD